MTPRSSARQVMAQTHADGWKPIGSRYGSAPTLVVHTRSYARASVLPIGARVQFLRRDDRIALALTGDSQGWLVSGSNHKFAFGALMREHTNLKPGHYVLTQDGERWIIGERLDEPA